MKQKAIWTMAMAAGVLTMTMVGIEGCGSNIVKAQEADPTVMLMGITAGLETAWNQGDGAAYASYFTDDADFINIRGDIFSGSKQIAQVHGIILAGPFKGSHIAITMRALKVLAADVAMLDTDQTVTDFAALPAGVVPTDNGTLVTHFKYVAVKQTDGSWKLISGQNTSELPGRTILPPTI
ncbi:MAG: SgcJ/EcaC family oxidoreductase [Edaphobacter sp.]|uniref:SgcJ/EcaC family oxidoreductase n=1 Tax=Edaphobacter sp. TaxID=1934404 RepID=UPI0023A1D2C7|nr:SgcJ/EcaC family oxidoreductase [Edaphobacter sp.]MDE1175672.1 SgcJ/EcaC family oxidoreductase [Edaphobacter sp.]